MKKIKPTYQSAKIISVLPDEMVRLIVANNGNDFTNLGTNTYLIGTKNIAIIDPGPNIPEHFNNIKKAIKNNYLSSIILTHSHQDHCAMAIRLAKKTESKIFLWNSLNLTKDELIIKIRDETETIVDKRKKNSKVEIVSVEDGEQICSDEWCLEVITTPGHLSDHICLALKGSKVIFSGDHVMGWSSTVIVPPMGNMADYITSLKKLLKRKEDIYLPAHGPLLLDAKNFVKSQLMHRDKRKNQILALLKSETLSAKELADRLYPTIKPSLKLAAQHNIYAHLIDLTKNKYVVHTGELSIESRFSKKIY